MSASLLPNPYATPAFASLDAAADADDRRLNLGWALRGLDLLLCGWGCIVAAAMGAMALAMCGLESRLLITYGAMAALVVGTGFHAAGGACFVAARDSTAFRGWGLGCGLGVAGILSIFLADHLPYLAGGYGMALGNTLLVASCLAQTAILRRVATIAGEAALAAGSIVLLFLWGATFLVAFSRLFAAGPLAGLPLAGSSIRALTQPLDQVLAMFVFIGFLLGLLGTIAVTYFVRMALHQYQRRTAAYAAEAEIVE